MIPVPVSVSVIKTRKLIRRRKYLSFVPPVPNVYFYTDIPVFDPDDNPDEYIEQVRYTLDDGGDPDWEEGKTYTDKFILALTADQVLQMQGSICENFPLMNSKQGIRIAKQLESQTHKKARLGRGMHSKGLCAPLFHCVERIFEAASGNDDDTSNEGMFAQAFQQVEGFLLALSGGAQKGMNAWAYMDSDISVDLAGLMVVAVAHVLLGMGVSPDPSTPAGICYDSVLARMTNMQSPGDETEVYEMYEPKLRSLAHRREETAKVQLYSGENSDADAFCTIETFN